MEIKKIQPIVERGIPLCNFPSVTPIDIIPVSILYKSDGTSPLSLSCKENGER